MENSQFKITLATGKTFHLAISPDSSNIESSFSVDYERLSPPKICGRCAESHRTGKCRLLNALAPTLIFFSDLSSTENVTLEYTREDFYSRYQATAQQAGYVLCHNIIVSSDCDYFGKFKFLMDYYAHNFTYNMHMHMVLTTALLREYIKGHFPSKDNLFAKIRQGNKEFRDRLQFILEDVKMVAEKDAALNAFNIIFGLLTLSSDFMEEFYAELSKRVENMEAAN
jgi:hypothetical protein